MTINQQGQEMTETYLCLQCDARFISDRDWREHLKSKGHGAAVKAHEDPPKIADDESLGTSLRYWRL